MTRRADVLRELRSRLETLGAPVNEDKREEMHRELKTSQGPLISALRDVGVSVQDVYELVNSRASYRNAIPVLAEHLHRDYPPRVLEGIARALATRSAAPYWQSLLQAYQGWSDVGARQGAACAVAASATEEHLDKLLSVISNEAFGSSRVLLMPALVRLGEDDVVEPFLAELAQHPVLGREAASTLRRRRRRSK